jgi:hypothetical protein
MEDAKTQAVMLGLLVIIVVCAAILAGPYIGEPAAARREPNKRLRQLLR